jgi:hypothetical protein
MLTDEELTTRLSAALHDGAPPLTYAGPVPHVRRGSTGLAATSFLAATAALVLTPAALQHGDGSAPDAGPGTSRGPGPSTGPRVVRTLDLGGVHLSFATTDGDPGPLYAVGGNDLQVPDDAEKVDVPGVPGEYWFAKNPVGDEPQVYVGHRLCPDTTDGCDGKPAQLEVFGILAPGWTRDQLMQLLEHPVATERSRQH